MSNKQTMDGQKLDDIERLLAEDMLDPQTPIEVVREYLQAAGGDPNEIGREGAIFARELIDRRRLAWQEKARKRIARRAPLLERVGQLADMTKEQLVLRFNSLRSDPALGPQVAGAFHKRRAEESTEDELRTFLQEIETLRAIEASERDDEDGQ
jgi:hypothetical protein